MNLPDELARLGFLDEAILQQQGLIEMITSASYQPGEVIFHQGEENRLLFVVHSGLIKLVAYLPNGRSRIVRMHNRGSIFGLDGLLNQAHEHTAIAVDQVRLIQLPHVHLQTWKQDQPELYAQLLEKSLEHLKRADLWITDFSTGNIRGRVARLLKFLCRFESETGPQIVELLSTEEMAEILGVTPESVSRIIAEYKRQGILTSIDNNTEPLYLCALDELEQDAQT